MKRTVLFALLTSASVTAGPLLAEPLDISSVEVEANLEAVDSNALDRWPAIAEDLTLAITAKGHIAAQTSVLPDARLLYRVPDQPSADGNTVDMDRERVQFADNNVKYQSSLTFLNGEIKKMMSVLQG